jgi:hypothetical protein
LYLKGIDVIGATTAGEFIDGHQSEGEIAMILSDLSREHYSIFLETIGDEGNQRAANKIVKSALSSFNNPGMILLSTSFKEAGTFFDG